MILLTKLKLIFPDNHVFLHYVTSPVINGEIRSTLEVSGKIFNTFNDEQSLVNFVNALWDSKFGGGRVEANDITGISAGPLYVRDILDEKN